MTFGNKKTKIIYPTGITMNKILGYILSVFVFGGCTVPNDTLHAFSFDAKGENPKIEILDWSYGDSKIYGVHPEPNQHAAQSINIIGKIEPAARLYVKWRDKSSEKIFSENIELKNLLPKEMNGNRIHFSIIDNVIFVYLITKIPRPEGWPTYQNSYSKIYKTYKIIPN